MKILVQHNIGKAKHVVSFSDGTKKHQDGSEFFDVKIFKSKDKMNNFIRDLQTEPRNICWDCGKLFSTEPKYFLPKEEGQKQYLNCNHCGKVNHL